MKKNEIKQSPFIPLCKWFCMVTRSFSCSGWSHSSQMEVNERTEKKKTDYRQKDFQNARMRITSR